MSDYQYGQGYVVGEYEVWSVSRLVGDDIGDVVRVTLRNQDVGDTSFTCQRTEAPAVGSTVELIWR